MCSTVTREMARHQDLSENLKSKSTSPIRIILRARHREHEQKSAVARPVGRKSPSFSFTTSGQKRRITPKAIMRLMRNVRELMMRDKGLSLEQMTKELTNYLQGWKAYFEFPRHLLCLDQCLRRSLRTLIWKQWKRETVLYRKLCERGIRKDLAAHAARNPREPWRVANSPAMNTAYSPKYFDSIGLPRLLTVN